MKDDCVLAILTVLIGGNTVWFNMVRRDCKISKWDVSVSICEIAYPELNTVKYQ